MLGALPTQIESKTLKLYLLVCIPHCSKFIGQIRRILTRPAFQYSVFFPLFFEFIDASTSTQRERALDAPSPNCLSLLDMGENARMFKEMFRISNRSKRPSNRFIWYVMVHPIQQTQEEKCADNALSEDKFRLLLESNLELYKYQ